MDPKDTPLFLGPDDEDDDDNSPDTEPGSQTTKRLTAAATVAIDAPAYATLSSDSEDEDLQPAEDDDDPVVRTYDIYSTSDLAEYLYLFQYPVRNRQKPYTKAQKSCPVRARWKPRPGLVEVDVPINVHGQYDQEKGRQWGDVLRKAQATQNEAVGKAISQGPGKRRKGKEVVEDDEEAEDDVIFVNFDEAVKKGRVLNKQTLGSKIQPDETRYMVGVFRNDQLHLTPIKSTLQLRPQFHHIDAQLAQERAANKALRDADTPPAAAGTGRVQTQYKSTDDPNGAHINSNLRAQRMAEEDEWTDMHWIDPEDEAAWDQYELLCLKDPKSAGPLKPKTTKTEYMDWLSGAMFRHRT